MKLDKKSLIQIVILIVLVIGGAGAYLAQQEGGLDFVSGLFKSEPATIRAPTPAAARKPAPGPAATAPSARLELRHDGRPRTARDAEELARAVARRSDRGVVLDRMADPAARAGGGGDRALVRRHRPEP